MSTNDLLRGLDPDCPTLNELCGRVEDQVKASGLRGRAGYTAEMERLKPLLAQHRATCDLCRGYQPKPYFADYRLWPIFAVGALGYVVGLASAAPKVGGGIGISVGAAVTLLLFRRRRLPRENP